MVRVSVVVPMRNEEDYIGACLRSLLNQNYPVDQYEVIVLDGRSSDRSRERVSELQRQYQNVQLLDNVAEIVPAAMNLGIQRAKGDIIVRADAHTVYPPNYVESCVKYLESSGADNVGGPLITTPVDDSFSARLVAAVITNPFGVGNSRFRVSMREGFVDTVPFGVFRKALFARIGLYNERLVRNQDNDLNARIRKSGGKIYQTPDLTTKYYPVNRFRRLLGKTFRECQWHIFTLRENSHALGIRHLVPALFVLVFMSLFFLGFFSRWALLGLYGVLTVYIVTAVYYAIRAAGKYGFLLAVALPFAFLCFHISYGLGTLAGLRWFFWPAPTKPIRV